MKKGTLLLISLICCLLLQAQTPPTTTKNTPIVSIPTSPEAAALSIRGSYSTGKFSGSMAYDLPIYSLKMPGLEIPIGLHYQSNGVRVDEIASRVGLGWSLEAGGVISRTIMNYPDEQTAHHSYPPNIPINQTDNAWLTFIQTGLIHGQNDIPDVFSFSFLNYSGKFYLTQDLTAVIMVPYQNLKITYDTSLQSFTIKTPDGNTFVFSTKGTTIYAVTGNETGLSDSRSSQQATTSWQLTKITTPFGDNVNFQYDTNYQYSYNQDISQLAYGAYTGWNGTIRFYTYPEIVQARPFNTTYNYYIAREPLLRKIETTRYGSVLFTDDASLRLDFEDYFNTNTRPHKLKSIDIYNGKDTSPVKHVDLASSYTTSTDNNYGSQNMGTYGTFNGCLNRLFLDNVTFEDTEKYTFGYNRRSEMPRVMSYARDPWGYYDGNRTKQSLISVPSDAYDIGFSGLQSVDQTPNPNYTSVGMLNIITYPTGGSRNIEFEQNGYSGNFVGGCRVSRTYENNTDNNPFNIIRYYYNTYEQRATPLFTCYSNPVFVEAVTDLYLEGTYGARKATRLRYSSGVMTSSTCAGNPCFYPVVTESYGNNFENGGKEYYFTGGCDESPESVVGNMPTTREIQSATHPDREKLIKETTFTVSNNTKQVQKELEYTYGFDESKTNTIYGFVTNRSNSVIKVYDYPYPPGPTNEQLSGANSYYGYNPLTWLYNYEIANGPTYVLRDQFGLYESYFQLYRYKILSKCIQLQKVVERDFLNGNLVDKTTNYLYNSNNLLSSKEDVLETGNTLKEMYKYSNEYNFLNSDPTIQALKKMNDNYIVMPIEVTKWRNNMVVGGNLSKFNETLTGNYFLPSEKLSLKLSGPSNSFTPTATPDGGSPFIYDSHYTTDVFIDKYDIYGNIMQYHKPDNVNVSFMWGYNNTLPVIKAKNVDWNTLNAKASTALSYCGYSTLETLLGNSTSFSDVNWASFNRTLRSNLPDALVNTYTYKPVIGMTSQTDPRGICSYYTYDTANRLYLMRDDDRKILGTYRYAYQNNPDNGQGGYSLAATISTNANMYSIGNTCYASVNTSGGSGNYTYNWSVVNNSSGVVIASTTSKSANYSFSISQTGSFTICCNVNDNLLGTSKILSTNISCSNSCSGNLNVQSGFYNLSNSLTSDGTNVTIILAFYPIATMQVGTRYLIESISSGNCNCRPSATRTMFVSPGGRSFYIEVSPQGYVYCTIVSGTAISPYSSVGIGSLSYKL